MKSDWVFDEFTEAGPFLQQNFDRQKNESAKSETVANALPEHKRNYVNRSR